MTDERSVYVATHFNLFYIFLELMKNDELRMWHKHISYLRQGSIRTRFPGILKWQHNRVCFRLASLHNEFNMGESTKLPHEINKPK